MGYGAKFINPDTGAILVDDTFANLAVITAETRYALPKDYSFGGGTAQTGFGQVGLSVSATGGYPPPPIMAFRKNGYQMFLTGGPISSFDPGGGQPVIYTRPYTLWIYVPEWVNNMPVIQTFQDGQGNYYQAWTWNGNNNYQGIPIDVFWFGRPTEPSGQFGLKVKDAESAMTFHSSFKYMKLVDNKQGTNYQSGAPSGSYDASKTYAVMFMRPHGTLIKPTSNSLVYDAKALFCGMNGASFTSTERIYDHPATTYKDTSVPSGTATYNQLKYSIGILDVTYF